MKHFHLLNDIVSGRGQGQRWACDAMDAPFAAARRTLQPASSTRFRASASAMAATQDIIRICPREIKTQTIIGLRLIEFRVGEYEAPESRPPIQWTKARQALVKVILFFCCFIRSASCKMLRLRRRQEATKSCMRYLFAREISSTNASSSS